MRFLLAAVAWLVAFGVGIALYSVVKNGGAPGHVMFPMLFLVGFLSTLIAQLVFLLAD